MTRTRRRWPRRIAGLVVLALALELVARWLLPPRGGYPDGLFVADERAGFRMQSSFSDVHALPDNRVTISTNSLGLRDDEPDPLAAQRILVLGDSFVFGHGVEAEEALPAVLQSLLAPVEVLNAGVPGYGTLDEHALFLELEGTLAPDLVLVGLYVGNDFMNNLPGEFGRITARSGVLVTLREGDSEAAVTLKAAVFAHSRLLSFVLALSQFATGGGETPARPHVACPDFEWGPAIGCAIFRREWDPLAAAAFEATTAALEALAASCADREVLLCVVLLPGPVQYCPPLWRKALKRCGHDAAEFDLEKPDRLLVEWGREAGVRVLDLLPAFRVATEARPDDYLFTDVHFSVAGHRLAAEKVALFLESLER